MERAVPGRPKADQRGRSCAPLAATDRKRPCQVDHQPLAEHEGVAFVCRLLLLTCLAPDIVEAILDCRQPKGLRPAEQLGIVARAHRGWLGQVEVQALFIERGSDGGQSMSHAAHLVPRDQVATVSTSFRPYADGKREWEDR